MGDSYFSRRLEEILATHPGEFTRGRFPSEGNSKHPDYNCWRKMRSRCNDPANPDFAYYGGRGIKVCPAWDDFGEFLFDMGPRPSPLHTIDRINRDGDYEPGNCRWATRAEQNRNKRPGGFAVKPWRP